MRRREIELVRELFPHLSIVLIARHPVDRMWSALRRHWTYSYLDDVADVGKDVSSMLGYADQRLADASGDYRAIYPTLRTCRMAGITIKDGPAPVF